MTTIQDPKKQVDLTEERQRICEPVVKKILELLIDKNVLLRNLPYIEQKVQADLEAYLKSLLPSLMTDVKNIIFDQVTLSLQTSVNQAIDSFWSKQKEDVTVGDVQEVLLRKKKIPDEK